MPKENERKKITMLVPDKCKCKYEIEIHYVDGVWRYPNFSNPGLRHLISCPHGRLGDAVD